MTMGIAVLYFRRLKRVQREYKEAKNVVGNIVLDFNKQIEREELKISAVANKTKVLSLLNEGIIKQIEGHDKQLTNLSIRIEKNSGIELRALERFEKVDKKMEAFIKKLEEITKRIAGFTKLETKVSMLPKTEIEAVIPLRKETVLSPLTKTELMVLETLAIDGEKTAPEIMKSIELSREHTSRLMKKLYQNGYLERDTQKIPYTYRLKKEMMNILR
jgi:hypothetical protein